MNAILLQSIAVMIVATSILIWAAIGVIRWFENGGTGISHDEMAKRVSVALFSVGLSFVILWLVGMGKVIWTLAHH